MSLVDWDLPTVRFAHLLGQSWSGQRHRSGTGDRASEAY